MRSLSATPKHQVEMDLNGLALVQNVSGTCVVDLTVDDGGQVIDATAAPSCPELFARSAERAAMAWTFQAGDPGAHQAVFRESTGGPVVSRADAHGALHGCPWTPETDHADQDLVFYSHRAVPVDSHRALFRAPVVPGSTLPCPVRLHVQRSRQVSKVVRYDGCWWNLSADRFEFEPGDLETIDLVLSGTGVQPYREWLKKSAIGCVFGGLAITMLFVLVRQPD